jgi:uncharacterized repeat protein (TIGR01451 family)
MRAFTRWYVIQAIGLCGSRLLSCKFLRLRQIVTSISCFWSVHCRQTKGVFWSLPMIHPTETYSMGRHLPFLTSRNFLALLIKLFTLNFIQMNGLHHRAVLLICIAALLFPCTVHGQNLFGNTSEERFTIVKTFGSEVYVAGFRTLGSKNRASLSRFTTAGVRQWTVELDTSTSISDFTKADNGNIVFVGINRLYDASTFPRSMAGAIASTGSLVDCRYYDFAIGTNGRETFSRIVRDPSPANPSFPYLILGIKVRNISNDDIVFASCDATGLIGSASVSTTAADNQLNGDLIQLSGGGFAICGSILNSPTISFYNASKVATGGWTFPPIPAFNISSMVEKPTASGASTIVWVTSGSATTSSRIVRTNRATGATLWAYESGPGVNFLKVFDRSGQYYVIEAVTNGNGSLTDYRLVQITEAANEASVTVDWSRSIRSTETGIGPMSIAQLPNQWVVADGRAGHPNSLGGFDGFLAMTNLGLGSCTTVNSTDVAWTKIASLTPTASTTGMAALTLPSPVSNQVSNAPTITAANFCQNCDATSVITQTSACPPTYSFVGSSSVSGGTYTWLFGDATTGTGASVSHAYPPTNANYTVRMFYETIGGCSDTVVTTLNVTIPPLSVTCPPNITISTGPNICQAPMPNLLPNLSVTGGCPPYALTQFPSVGTLLPIGLTNATIQISNGGGVTPQTCNVSVTVRDQSPPVITSTPPNVTLTATCGQTCTPHIFSFASSDPCGTVTTNLSHNSGFCFPIGMTNVVYTATDVSGNQAQSSFKVTVLAGPSPDFTLTCPADITATLPSGQPNVAVNYPQATTTGGCSTPTITYSIASGSKFGCGTTLVTCTATSGGIVKQCTFKVTVTGCNSPYSIVMTKTATPSPALAGQHIVFNVEYTISNSNGGNLQNVVITDVIDPAFEIVSVPYPPNTYNISGNTVKFLIGPGVIGSTFHRMINVRFKPGKTCNGTVACNQATLTGNDGTIDVAAVSNSVCVTAQASNQWKVEKQFVGGGVVDGLTCWKLIVIDPNGQIGGLNMSNVKITEVLPLGATLESVSGAIANQTTGTIELTPTNPNFGTLTNTWTYFVIDICVKYPASHFQTGQTVTNSFKVDFTSPCGAAGSLTSAPVSTTLTAPNPGTATSKFLNTPFYFGSPTIAAKVPGCNHQYVVRLRNSGNVPLTNYVATDILPDAIRVTKIRSINPTAGLLEIRYRTHISGLWQSQTVQAGGTNTVVVPASDYITHIEWKFATMPIQAPNNSIDMYIDFEILAARYSNNQAVVAGYVVENILTTDSDQTTATTIMYPFTIDGSAPKFATSKWVVNPCGQSSTAYYYPGDKVRFRMAVANVGNETATNCEIMDALNANNTPPNTYFSYAGNARYSFTTRSSFAWAYDPNCMTLVPLNQFQNTTLGTVTEPAIGDIIPKWTFGALESSCDDMFKVLVIEFDVLIQSAPLVTPYGGYLNRFTISASNATTATSTWATFAVNSIYGMTAQKMVKKSTDPNSAYSTTANVAPGQMATYKLTITNAGNVGLKDIKIFDLLPKQANDILVLPPYTSRGSQFDMFVTAPLSVNSSGQAPVLQYSTQGNPSRSEHLCPPLVDPLGAVSGTFNANAGAGKKSLLMTFPSNYTLPPNSSIDLTFSATVPPSTTVGQTACNSFAVQATPLSGTACTQAFETVKACVVATQAPPVCTASFTASATDSCGAVKFTSTATGAMPLTYTWIFGDGSPNSNDPNPTHTYASSGNFTVALTVRGADGCMATFSLPIQNYLVFSNCPVPPLPCVSPNNCLDFDGQDDFVAAASPLSSPSGPFTIACWFRDDKPVSTDNNLYRIFCLGNGTNRLEIGDNQGRLALSRAGNTPTQSTSNIRDGQWHHVALTYNGTVLNTYLDGAPVSALSGVSIGALTGLNAPYRIGNWTGGTGTPSNWLGRIDEFKIWKKALTAVEVNDALRCGLDVSNTDLVVHFPFDENLGGGNNLNPGGLVVTNVATTGTPNNGNVTFFARLGTTSNWVARGADRLPPCSAKTYLSLEGDTRRNHASRSKYFDGDILSIGDESGFANGTAMPLSPTVTRRAPDGTTKWRTVLTIRGTARDIVQSVDGCALFVVGSSPIFSSSSSSFVARLDASTGSVTWIRRYEIGQSEEFTRIEQSKNPVDPTAPYVILGIRNTALSTFDQQLVTMRDDGTISSSKKVGTPSAIDRFSADLAQFNGKYVIGGNQGSNAGLLFLDNTLAVANTSGFPSCRLVFDTGRSDVRDIQSSGDGKHLLIAGMSANGDAGFLMKVDFSNLASPSVVWSRRFANITAIERVIARPDGTVHLIGRTKANFPQSILFRGKDNGTSYSDVWAKSIRKPGETAWHLGDMVYYGDRMLFYNDSRNGTPNNYGDRDILKLLANDDLPDNSQCFIKTESYPSQSVTVTLQPLPMSAVDDPLPTPLISGNGAPMPLPMKDPCAPVPCTCAWDTLKFTQAGMLLKTTTCGSSTITSLQCPGQNQPIYLTGKLNCLGNCTTFGFPTWTLKGPNGAVIANGGNAFSNVFTIPLTLALLQTPGQYTVTITGKCGTSTCTCEVKFTVPACQAPCACNAAFNNAVDAGFSYTKVLGTCTFTYTPNGALTDCDSVTWRYVANTGGSNFITMGRSKGTNPFTFTFPSNTNPYYIVAMDVLRYAPGPPVGQCQRTSAPLIVPCTLPLVGDAGDRGNGPCDDGKVENYGFVDGAYEGAFSAGGTVLKWDITHGDAEVWLDSGALDINFVRLRGNAAFFDRLYQANVPVTKNDSLQLTIAYRPIASTVQPGSMLVVEWTSDTLCNLPTNCEEIMRLSIPEPTTANDSIWRVGFANHVLKRDGGFFAVRVENPFIDPDEAFKTIVDVDNICLRKFNFVKTGDVPDASNIEKLRVYPNPTSGLVTIDFIKPLSEHAILTLFDLSGRVLDVQKVEKGQSSKQLDLTPRPEGFYFVELRMPDGTRQTARIVQMR